MAKLMPFKIQYTGREGTYFVRISNKEKRDAQSLAVRVRVLEARKAFGRLDFKITPVAGSGELWVSADNVNLNEESEWDSRNCVECGKPEAQHIGRARACPVGGGVFRKKE